MGASVNRPGIYVGGSNDRSAKRLASSVPFSFSFSFFFLPAFGLEEVRLRLLRVDTHGTVRYGTLGHKNFVCKGHALPYLVQLSITITSNE